jgi:hypothetical protein
MFYTNQDNMPNKNKLILGTSSFWILNLIYYSFLEKLYLQSLLLTSITIISPIFWYNYKINSIYHKLDNYVSILIFIYIILYNYLLLSYIDIFFIISFYYTSLLFTIYKKYNIQLCFHLLFRLYFYKIIFLTINKNNILILYYDISKYILNNIFLIIITNNNYNLIKYILYSFQIIFILYI